jgi:uncharacterized protein (DUF1810 family)
MVAMESADPYNLQRFVHAQHPIYAEVLDELQDRKTLVQL